MVKVKIVADGHTMFTHYLPVDDRPISVNISGMHHLDLNDNGRLHRRLRQLWRYE